MSSKKKNGKNKTVRPLPKDLKAENPIIQDVAHFAHKYNQDMAILFTIKLENGNIGAVNFGKHSQYGEPLNRLTDAALMAIRNEFNKILQEKAAKRITIATPEQAKQAAFLHKAMENQKKLKKLKK